MTLKDKKIAVTGVLESFSREGIKDFILSQGGKFSSAVSGKTDILLTGNYLEDGRPYTEGTKYRTAVEKNVKILTEPEFMSLYTPKEPTQGDSMEISAPAPTSQVNSTLPNVKTETKPINPNPVKTETNSSSTPSSNFPLNSSLWVDKYSPKRLEDVVGHNDIINKLRTWLNNWEAVHIKKTMKIPFSKENPGAKSCLISGPPGIGKTTLTNLVGRTLGYEVMELNASDTRNKSSLEKDLQDAVSNRVISFSNKPINTTKRLIIMDEVDGMGGSDRGGITELIKIIKISKMPIICICNDRQSPKIKSLANSCYDLRIRRPTKQQIANRLVAIGQREGIAIEPNAAELLVEESGNDIRSSINALHMWSIGSKTNSNGSQIKYQEMKDNLHRIEKDKVLRLSPFDACLKILSGSKPGVDNLNERYEGFFIDYSLLPLLIEQNYIDTYKNGVFNNKSIPEIEKYDRLMEACESVSDLDLLDKCIHGLDQNWSLLPSQAATSIRVGHYASGFMPFPSFPQYLGKYSSRSKRVRLITELKTHTSLSCSNFSNRTMRLDYSTYLREHLLSSLVSKGKDGVEETIQKLIHYDLSKDDLMESLQEIQILTPPPAANPKAPKNSKQNIPFYINQYDLLDTQTKSSFTRNYNTTSFKSSTIIPELNIKTSKKKKTTPIDDDLDYLKDEEEIENQNEEEDEEEDIEQLRAQLQSKKSKTKSTKSTETKEKAPRKKK